MEGSRDRSLHLVATTGGVSQSPTTAQLYGSMVATIEGEDSMPQKPCLKAALAYLERGWSAIPLCPPDHQGVNDEHEEICKKPGKCPLIKWEIYQERLAKPVELKMQFNRWPNANVGIVLGPVSGLLGLDIDGEEGEQLLASLGQLPDTLEFTTGGGRRLLFQHPAEAQIKSVKKHGKEAVRVLTRGSQTVAPPSIHWTGEPYSWRAGHGPGEIEPAKYPAWLLEKLLDQTQAIPGPVGDDQVVVSAMPNSDNFARAVKFLLKCEPAIAGQGGHNQTYKIACKLIHGFHLDPEQAFSLLLSAYNPRCVPPWTEKELHHKVESAQTKGSSQDYLAMPKKQPPLPTTELGPEAISRRYQEVKKTTVEWLVPGWVPLGKLTMLDGDPGLGKSTMLLDLASRVSTHGIMFNNKQGLTGNVVIMSAEDAADDTIRPRLEAAGANLERIIDLSHAVYKGEERLLEIPADLKLIEKTIKQYQARLLIVDPLMAFLVGADANKDQEIRRVLFKLYKLAEKTRCAIIAMRHLNKGGGTKAIYRGNSSIAVIGQARVGLLVGIDPDSEDKRILAMAKINCGPMQTSLRFALEPIGDVCRIGWCGESLYKADQLVTPPPSEETQQKQQEEKSKLELCLALMQELLAQGPQVVKSVKQELMSAGFAHRTIERAAGQLKLTLGHHTEDGVRIYTWALL